MDKSFNEQQKKGLIEGSTFAEYPPTTPALSQQLYILSQNIRQTELGKTMTLDDLFEADEMQRHLRRQNAWNYICYGNCTLNGGHQPTSSVNRCGT